MPRQRPVSVDVMGFEKVKSLASVLIRISNDERIPLTVREEYVDIVNEILEQGQGGSQIPRA